jgi:tetratricopeptide (TPR) repeat protein
MKGNGGRPRPGAATSTLLLLAACIVCYANGLTGDFTYDDKAIVRDDPRIREPAGIAQIFSTPYFGGPRGVGTGFRPIVLTSYAVQWWLHGRAVVGYHVANVLLHALVTLLLVRFLLRLAVPEPAAFGAALLFAVHPIHVEAVTSLVGRAETLAAVFVFGFLLAALAFRRASTGRALPLAAALLCYGLGLLTKESAAVAPALAFLAFWRLEEGSAVHRVGNALRSGIPLYAGAAVLLALDLAYRRWVLGGFLKSGSFRIFELENPLAPLAPLVRAANAATILLRYAGRLLVPLRLSSDESAWSIPVRRGFDAAGLAALLLLAAIASICVVRERERREVAFGVLFFLMAFVATANVFFATGTILAERLAYLPSAGFALALAAGMLGSSEQARIPRFRAAVFLTIGLAFAVRTVERNRVWKSDETLFAESVRTSPESAKAHYNLAWVSMEHGRLAPALEEYTRATRIYPKYFDAWAGKGLAEQRLGLLAEAERSYAKSIEIAPSYENGFFRLGFVRELRGNLPGAERAYSLGLEKHPRSTPLAFRLAKVRSQLDRPTAEADWRHAIEIARGSSPFRLGFAQWLLGRGRIGEARFQAREVLRRRPGEVAALRLLADTSRDAGRRFAEGLAAEKILGRTRVAADLDRLRIIAAEDPAYATRFRALEPSLSGLTSRPSASRGRRGAAAGSAPPARVGAPPALSPADAGGGRSEAPPSREGTPRGRSGSREQ